MNRHILAAGAGMVLPGGHASAAPTPVVAPDPASQSKSAGQTLTAITFGAFTDVDGRIASYQLLNTQVRGGAVVGASTGDGLGPYPFTTQADGDSGFLQLHAKDSDSNILATATYGYDRDSAGAGSWVDPLDFDFEDVTTASAITTGTVTLAFESTSDTLDVTATSFSGNNGSLTPTNGQGLLAAGGGAAGATTFAFDFVSELAATWDAAYVGGGYIAVDVYVESVTYVNVSDYIFAGLSPNTTHNSGGTRVWYMARDTVATDEDRRTRNNSSNGAVIDTVPIKTTRVFTFVLDASTVHLGDTSGTTAPSDPRPFSTGLVCAGGDQVNQQATGTTFSSAAYAVMSVGQQTSYTIKRLRVRRYQ